MWVVGYKGFAKKDRGKFSGDLRVPSAQSAAAGSMREPASGLSASGCGLRGVCASRAQGGERGQLTRARLGSLRPRPVGGSGRRRADGQANANGDGECRPLALPALPALRLA